MGWPPVTDEIGHNNNTEKYNMTTMTEIIGLETTKEYHVGVDVTYSTWVRVTASSQEEAEELAKVEAEDNTSKSGAWVGSEVHSIYQTYDEEV